MSATLVRRVIFAIAVGAGVLLFIVAQNSTTWIGRTFPGFFVMANRVVPSIALAEWAGGGPSRIFQHAVVEVDDRPVDDSAAVYAYAESHPVGTSIRYSVRARDGVTWAASIPSRRFSDRDYALLFGAYLLNAVAFLVVGLTVAALKPRIAPSYALLSVGLATGLFALTAVDLYGPHWFFRLHVLAEACLPASYIHLALVFPTDRIRQRRRAALVPIYATFWAFALVYELVLHRPSAYTRVHLVASALHGAAAMIVIVAIVSDVIRTRSPLLRRRVGVVGLGTLAAFSVPGILWAWSAVRGGGVPLNAAAFTAFLFPVSLGYAIAKQDLFEIDVMLRRATTYAIVVVAIGAVYLAVLWALGMLLPMGAVARSPLLLASINLAVLFLLAPLKSRVQAAVDQVFLRKGYDAERSLSELGRILASAHTLEAVVHHTGRVLDETVYPITKAILLADPDGTFLGVEKIAKGRPASLTLGNELTERLRREGLLARYEWDDGSGRPLPDLWRSSDAEVVVGIRSGDTVIGVLAVGPKASGRPYTTHDASFLRTIGNQLALAILNARAFGQLEGLNVGLEAQVRDRTAALERTNDELNRSLNELHRAYQALERNQASLMRADRLATLGRLIAGIAHEVNTPLGAVLNALTLLRDLEQEYERAIGDPEVTADDHREIARDMLTATESAAGWARRAASFISKVKMHGREPRQSVAQTFAVSAVVDETRELLAHRLRTIGCRVDYTERPAGVTLSGEPGRLGQVFVNLMGNAIDAYEDHAIDDARIAVDVAESGGILTIAVRDWAGGMPPDVANRIFEELYTTKAPGRGTGLGLWIARNLVEETFGGTLTVETTLGAGSCFTLTVPCVKPSPIGAAGRGDADTGGGPDQPGCA